MASLVLCGFECCFRRLDLGLGNVKVLFPWLRLELLKQRQGGLRLRLQLFRGRPLNGIIDQHQRIAFVHRLALGDENLLHGAGNFRIHVDVFAAGLIAFHNAFRVDAVGVRIREADERRAGAADL